MARKLFTPLTLGGKHEPVQLLHRVVMAPLTRLRCGEEGVPTDSVATYYSQRSTKGGLLISEGAYISATARGYFGAPGLFRDDQLDGWKKVTNAVHAKGGKIFAQLWHTGRVGHPLNQPDGALPVSSSAIGIGDAISFAASTAKSVAVTREGRKPYVTPRALETNEISAIVADYKRAAENAVAVGFDGVEIHSANGYLLEQFLCDGVNKRSDKYGGSVEKRGRFLFEVLDAITSSVASSKVGIRLSPFGVTFGCTDSDPATTYAYVIKKLNDYDLAYLHLIEPRGFHFTSPLVPEGGVTKFFRPMYNGVILTASGYSREEALQVVEDNTAEAVAFGTSFISNPDLVKRLEIDASLNTANRKTFYLGTDVGYTDYPFLTQHQSSL